MLADYTTVIQFQLFFDLLLHRLVNLQTHSWFPPQLFFLVKKSSEQVFRVSNFFRGDGPVAIHHCDVSFFEQLFQFDDCFVLVDELLQEGTVDQCYQ